MKTFHLVLQRIMVATFVLCFVFVSLYTPQPWNKINEAEASAATGGSTEWTQIANNVQLLWSNITASAAAASNAITASATGSSWLKDNVLDGIAWTLAKNILSQMTSSIVKWINSGFKGSPAFVQDMNGFLTNVADETIGAYIQKLGGPLSFICSPFQLDVRIALSASYARARDGQPAAPTCTLSGALANIENFMDGSFDQGGWDAWFTVSTKPETYTPYGNLLTVKNESSYLILNAKNEQTKLLEFGGGFLSSKICEAVSGAGTTKEKCFISTPGKVIQEALTFQLSTGPESLIAADEFNEIIVALFAQLSEKAITGAAGLLGLSGGTGYTYEEYDGSYLDEAAGSTLDLAKFGDMLDTALLNEINYETGALNALPVLTAYATNTLNDPRRRELANIEKEKIPALLIVLDYNITALTDLQADFIALGPTPSSSATSSAAIQTIFGDFTSLTLHQAGEVAAAISNWANIVK